MFGEIKKYISYALIFSLLWSRVFLVPQILAEEEIENSNISPTKTPTAPKPTTPPRERSDPKPTSEPVPSQPPKPTGSIKPTSAPLPTYPPQPTNEPVSTVAPQDALNKLDSESPATDFGEEEGEGEKSSNQEGNESNGKGIDDPLNSLTGSNSDNSASKSSEYYQEIVNKNLAKLEEKVEAISITGFNSADLNTFKGEIKTGDAFATLNLLNKLNSNISGLGGFQVFNVYGNYFGDIVFSMEEGNPISAFTDSNTQVSKNSITGPNSENITNAQNNFVVKQANGNDAFIGNDIELTAVSGGNSASGNTMGGSVKTGDATAFGNIINIANTNLNVSEWLIGVVNIFGSLAGNIVLPKDDVQTEMVNKAPGTDVGNFQTGPLGSNQSSSSSETIASFENNNLSQIETDLDLSANTGKNDASLNTGGGDIETGSSDISVANSSVANTNVLDKQDTVWLVVVNEMGKWVGHIIGAPDGSNTASNYLPIDYNLQSGEGGKAVSNEITGPLSVNESSYKDTFQAQYKNENESYIKNNVLAVSDTGNNKASINTGPGIISTGEAKTGLNLFNMTNTNVSATKFIAVFVNVFDIFLGQIVPPDQETPSIEFPHSYSDFSNWNSNQPELPDNKNRTGGPSDEDKDTEVLEGENYPLGTDEKPNNKWQNNKSQDDYLLGGSSGSNNFPDNYEYQYNKSYSRYNIANNNINDNLYKPDYNPNASDFAERLYTSSQVNISQVEPRRGIFVSPAFAKATQSSFAAILFDGAKIKISSSYLTILPLAAIMLFLRRREKFVSAKSYLVKLLDIIL